MKTVFTITRRPDNKRYPVKGSLSISGVGRGTIYFKGRDGAHLFADILDDGIAMLRNAQLSDSLDDEEYKFELKEENDEHELVSRTAPRWVWELIDEILEQDSRAGNFDRELRDRIAQAIERLQEENEQ